MKSETESN